MALIEKDLADELVELRAAINLGHNYTPATDLEKALQRHLDREQWWRAELGRLIVDGDTPGRHGSLVQAMRERGAIKPPGET